MGARLTRGLRRLVFTSLVAGLVLGGVEAWARSRWTLTDVQLTDGPSLYRDHPTLFWTLRPNSTTVVGPTRYVTNSLGMRGPEIDTPKPSGRFRVLLLGESSTIGMGIDEPRIYASVLGGLLAAAGIDADVANAGVGAWTVWQSSIYLEEEGIDLKPDVVIAYHQLNDFLPRGVIDPHNFLYAVPYSDRELYQRRKWAAPALGLLLQSRAYLAFRKEVLITKAQLPSIHSRGDFPPRVPEADRREAWNTIHDVCVEHGAKLVMVRPFYERTFDRDALLTELATQFKAPLVDIPPLAHAPGAPQPFLMDGIHPSEGGHAVIARALADVVIPMAGGTSSQGP